MYSASHVPVDKALGFDFSEITNLAKSILPVGLNLYQNQMQIKQIQAMRGQSIGGGYALPMFGPYGQQAGQLPLAQSFAPQPTFGNAPYVQQQGMSTTTMLMLGAALVGGLVVLKKAMS